MTDDEINARVATLLGYSVAHDDRGRYISTDDWRWPLPNYLTDPAAFIRLWDWLVVTGWKVTMIEDRAFTTVSMRHDATLRGSHVADRTKGRALALAALRAHGVEA